MVFPNISIQCLATDGKVINETVTGPIGDPVEAFYGITGDEKTAIIEMASASGLHHVPLDKRNPLITTTKGTGELILAALNHGVESIIIGIGGSATNDGGVGMAQALGANLVDKFGNDIGFGGGELSKIQSINLENLDSRLQNITIDVACDVDNPLTGERGATAVFGLQKGATPEMVSILDQNLTRFAHLLKRDHGIKVGNIPGSGAAGGLGAGLLAFLGATLKSGVDIIIEATKLEKQMDGASMIITEEGKIDIQTIYGKTPIGVAKTAKKLGIPVIAIAGSLGDGSHAVYEHGIDALFSIVPGTIPLETALANGKIYTEQLAENIARTWKISPL